MKRRIGVLVSVTAGLWAVLSYPASRIWGSGMFLHSAGAMLLCMLPAVATLILARPEIARSPARQLQLMVGSMAIRMAVVLGGGALLYFAMESFKADAFWIWLAVFYLTTLAVETALIVGGLKSSGETAAP